MANQLKIEKGLVAALLIICLWFIAILGFFQLTINWYNPLYYLICLVPAHLYTGLFITAHESWHGNISTNKKLNRFMGVLACNLFAYNSYNRIQQGHHRHHTEPTSHDDPEFSESRKFFPWLFKFVSQYVTLWQFLWMSITTTILLQFFKTENIVMYYLAPTFIATVQLFYFGTYLPHRGEYNNRHQSGTQKKNHVWAFLSCYFFGYHYEHHHSPRTPWYQLYKLKNENVKNDVRIPSY